MPKRKLLLLLQFSSIQIKHTHIPVYNTKAYCTDFSASMSVSFRCPTGGACDNTPVPSAGIAAGVLFVRGQLLAGPRPKGEVCALPFSPGSDSAAGPRLLGAVVAAAFPVPLGLSLAGPSFSAWTCLLRSTKKRIVYIFIRKRQKKTK